MAIKHQNNISSFHPKWCLWSKILTENRKATKNLTENQRTLSLSLSSPKIGCMSQIKRNRPYSSSTSSNSSSSSSSSSSKVSMSTSSSPSRPRNKLFKFTKVLLKRRSTSTSPAPMIYTIDYATTVTEARVSSVANLDPPLPVMKRNVREHAVSLWERRCGSEASDSVLKRLQIQEQLVFHVVTMQ